MAVLLRCLLLLTLFVSPHLRAHLAAAGHVGNEVSGTLLTDIQRLAEPSRVGLSSIFQVGDCRLFQRFQPIRKSCWSSGVAKAAMSVVRLMAVSISEHMPIHICIMGGGACPPSAIWPIIFCIMAWGLAHLCPFVPSSSSPFPCPFPWGHHHLGLRLSLSRFLHSSFSRSDHSYSAVQSSTRGFWKTAP